MYVLRFACLVAQVQMNIVIHDSCMYKHAYTQHRQGYISNLVLPSG